jgi:hypothetical protein
MATKRKKKEAPQQDDQPPPRPGISADNAMRNAMTMARPTNGWPWEKKNARKSKKPSD